MKKQNFKRCIITPTYSGHFKYITYYLKSFNKYLIDKDFPIYFIITKAEHDDFMKIISPYKAVLNLNIVYLDDILDKYGINGTPDDIFKLYGRLSFQTIKKLYGALFINYDQFLLLDSESMLINPTNMNDLFDKYFEKPSVVVSNVSDRPENYKNDFTYNYIQTVAKILGNEPEFWLVESYNWFYELRILKDLVKTHGAIIDIVKSAKLGKFDDLEGVLECLLYYQYIINNNDKYKYNIVSISKELKKSGLKFLDDFDSSGISTGGYFELFSFFLDEKNLKFFEDFVIRNNLKYVLRFENSKFIKNINTQFQFINTIKPNILASSQSHCFGIHNTFARKLNAVSVNMPKLGKHIKVLLHPLKICLEPFSITYYLCGFLKDVICNIGCLLRK